MKQRIIVVFMLMVASMLVNSCNSTPTPDLQATVDARVAQEMEQKETADALAADQATVEAEKVIIAETQTAMAIPPTSVPPTATEVVPTATLIPVEPGTVEEESMVSCPFYVYADRGSELNHFVPEGFMGDFSDIEMDENYLLDPERPNVIQIIYTPSGSSGWTGIYWWDPPGSNFGSKDGGFDLSCATKLTFWTRGENGGEKAEFKVGGIEGTYQDSLIPAKTTGVIRLTDTWVQYTIDLSGKSLNHIIGGFVWVSNDPDGGTIYLDDIMFEE